MTLGVALIPSCQRPLASSSEAHLSRMSLSISPLAFPMSPSQLFTGSLYQHLHPLCV